MRRTAFPELQGWFLAVEWSRYGMVLCLKVDKWLGYGETIHGAGKLLSPFTWHSGKSVENMDLGRDAGQMHGWPVGVPESFNFGEACTNWFCIICSHILLLPLVYKYQRAYPVVLYHFTRGLEKFQKICFHLQWLKAILSPSMISFYLWACTGTQKNVKRRTQALLNCWRLCLFGNTYCSSCLLLGRIQMLTFWRAYVSFSLGLVRASTVAYCESCQEIS